MPIRLIPAKTNFKFVQKRWICLAISLFICLGTLTLVMTKGLNFGIDFTGGALIEFETQKPADLAALRAKLGDVSIQTAGSDRRVDVRLPLTTSNTDEQAKIINQYKASIVEAAGSKVDFRKVDYVGPQVGSELIYKAIYALLGAFGAIMIYIWFRFEWQYGVGGLLALVHDAIAVIGFYSLTQIEFNLTSVAALLTIVGYSINDSVVIYDRVRENIRKYKKMPLGELIDLTVNETLSRTMITSFSVILALGALIIWGGDVLSSFSTGTAFGIIIGTYSSIYVSAILLLVFKPDRNFDSKKAKTPGEADITQEWVNE